jgi:peroxiredoxin
MAACNNNPDADHGRKVHDFVLNALNHDRFYLNQYRNRVVVLIFWSTTCRYCHVQLNEMKAVLKRHATDRLAIAAVCTDPENINATRRIAEDLAIGYPVLLDEGGRIYQRFGLKGLPTTVVIDQMGYCRLVRLGFSPVIKKQIETQIDRLLDGNYYS